MDQCRRRPGELLRPEGNGSHPGPQVATAALAPPLSPYFAEHVDGRSPSSGEPSPLGPGGRSSIQVWEVGGSLQVRHIEAETPCSSSCGRAPQAPRGPAAGPLRGAIPHLRRRSKWSHASRLSVDLVRVLQEAGALGKGGGEARRTLEAVTGQGAGPKGPIANPGRSPRACRFSRQSRDRHLPSCIDRTFLVLPYHDFSGPLPCD